MKSRIVQAIIILVVFAIGCAFFMSNNSAPTEDSSGYVPPSP